VDWQLAFEKNPATVLVIDQDLLIIAASKAAIERAFVPSSTLTSVYPSHVHERLRHWVNVSIDGGTGRFEIPGRNETLTAERIPLEDRFGLVVNITASEEPDPEQLRLKAVGLVSRFAVHETNNACGGALLAAENGLAMLQEPEGAELVSESLRQIAEAMQNCGRMAHELLAFARADHSWRSEWSLRDLAGKSVMLAAKIAPPDAPRPRLELSQPDQRVQVNGLELAFALAQMLIDLSSEAIQEAPPTLVPFADDSSYGFLLKVDSPNGIEVSYDFASNEYQSLIRTILNSHSIVPGFDPENRYIRLIHSGIT